MIPKVAGWKKDRVSQLTDIINSEGVVAVIDVSGVPASNMIDMRNTLRVRMSITMAKKSLMKIAWAHSERPADEYEYFSDLATQPCVFHSSSINAYVVFV